MPTNGDVRTVVIPAAGLGTRMLPATKTVPKELLPLVDRPIVQYGVEEAVRSGVRRVALVTNPGNTLTASHFAPHPAIERALAENGRTEALAAMRALAAMAEVTTLHQEAPLGLGHAVLCARSAAGDAPFAVLLPDDVIDAEPPALRRMIDVFTDAGGPVVLVERVPHHVVHRYGVIAAEPLGGGVHRVTDLVEKPAPDEAPSDLAIVGRYVLTPDTFDALEATGAGAGGEIQLTDGLRRLLRQRPVYAWELSGGKRLDAGTPAGFLRATIHFALKRPDLAAAIEEALGAARGVAGR